MIIKYIHKYIIILLCCTCFNSCTQDDEPYQIKLNQQLFSKLAFSSASRKINYEIMAGYKMPYTGVIYLGVIQTTFYLKIINNDKKKALFQIKKINLNSNNFEYENKFCEIFVIDEGAVKDEVEISPKEEKEVLITYNGRYKQDAIHRKLEMPNDEELVLTFDSNYDTLDTYFSNSIVFVPKIQEE
jgi:hypothetical protein